MNENYLYAIKLVSNLNNKISYLNYYNSGMSLIIDWVNYLCDATFFDTEENAKRFIYFNLGPGNGIIEIVKYFISEVDSVNYVEFKELSK